MQTEAIITILLSAAAFLKEPVRALASQSLKDVYATVKYYLRRKFGEGSNAAKALDFAIDKPASEARKAVLVEESASAGLEADGDLIGLMEKLAALLPDRDGLSRQNVCVVGQSNRVQVAGRDLVVNTTKHVQRRVITPDERHLSADQRERIRDVIAEVAERIAVGDGEPNFAAVHGMLQRRYAVVSYLLIPSGKFDDALGFLKQRRAIYRSRLSRRNPAAYAADFFRAIFAGAGELGWDRAQVYQFASDKLGLTKPLTSLKQLGPIQLKSVTSFIRAEIAHLRVGGGR